MASFDAVYTVSIVGTELDFAHDLRLVFLSLARLRYERFSSRASSGPLASSLLGEERPLKSSTSSSLMPEEEEAEDVAENGEPASFLLSVVLSSRSPQTAVYVWLCVNI